MPIHEAQIEVTPRILWVGAGFDSCATAHEYSLEAGLLRLENSRFDCTVVRLASRLEAERLLEVLELRRLTTALLVQLSENCVALAALLAHSGASKVYGPETATADILDDARMVGRDRRHGSAPSELLPWRKQMIGDSEAMRRVGDLVGRVAVRKSTVLITGESGSGKEVVAQALHAAGDRAGRPFQAVNCSALPEGLLESELFGHVRGAFTGAVQNRAGLFERANGGTVFLDEIGDMPVSLQAKLLRVLQEQQVQPLGGSATVKIDVRVIAATNRNLERAIADGSFREDLYYRLNVIPIHVAPLRARAEDIPQLAAYFVEKICRAERMEVKALTPPALARLCRYSWPGNVRELKNVIERAVVTGSDDRQIFPRDIDIPAPPVSIASFASVVPEEIDTEHGLDFEQAVGAFERSILERVMRQTSGNKTRAAELLRLRRTTLSAKLRALGAVA